MRLIRLRSISAHAGGAEISVALMETISGIETPFADTLVVIIHSLFLSLLESVLQIRTWLASSHNETQEITAGCVPAHAAPPNHLPSDPTAVDSDGLTCHPVGSVRSEVQYRTDNLFDLTNSSHRNATHDIFVEFLAL